MPKSRGPYPPEFRQQMVELVRTGRSPWALAQEFEPSGQTIRNWVIQAERDEGAATDRVARNRRNCGVFAVRTSNCVSIGKIRHRYRYHAIR